MVKFYVADKNKKYFTKTRYLLGEKQDKKECAMERLQLLVEANMIPALVQLAITDTSIQSDTSK